jgi:hypothetical protein
LSGTPLSAWTSRSAKVMPDPATRSLTVLDTRTGFGDHPRCDVDGDTP